MLSHCHTLDGAGLETALTIRGAAGTTEVRLRTSGCGVRVDAELNCTQVNIMISKIVTLLREGYEDAQPSQIPEPVVDLTTSDFKLQVQAQARVEAV